MDSNNRVNYGIEFKLVIVISCLIIASAIAATLFFGFTADEGKRGTFGDMFGAANALFTGLSFVGLIVTILLQRKDLNIQREELQKQTKSIQVQNFENTFFQILAIFHGIVDSLEIESDGQIIKGRKVFSLLHNKINKKLYDFTTTEEYQTRCNYLIEDIIRYTFIEKKDAINIYDEIYQEYSDVLGHYFRALYNVVKFADQNNDIEKQKYISIARSHLANSEQVLLYYNCLHPNGVIFFKPLVEKYALLNNIDWGYFPEDTFMLFYELEAYVN